MPPPLFGKRKQSAFHQPSLVTPEALQIVNSTSASTGNASSILPQRLKAKKTPKGPLPNEWVRDFGRSSPQCPR